MNGDQTLTLADAEARVATVKVSQFQRLTTGLDHEERIDDPTTSNALPPTQQLSGRSRSQRARVSSVLESSMICAVRGTAFRECIAAGVTTDQRQVAACRRALSAVRCGKHNRVFMRVDLETNCRLLSPLRRQHQCNPPFTARNDRLLESRVRLCQKGGQS
jgi:hypothetical protein